MIAYKKKVYALFYSEMETDNDATLQVRELCKMLGDRFEGISKVVDIKKE